MCQILLSDRVHNLLWTYQGSMHITLESLSMNQVHLYMKLADLEAIIFLILSIPLGYYTFSASPSMGFPETLRVASDRYIPFSEKFSKISPSLNIVWLWVSIFVPPCCKRKFL